MNNRLPQSSQGGVDPKDLKDGPQRWTHLSLELQARALAIYPVICGVYSVSQEQWLKGFLNDQNPDKEIAIWEKFAARLKKEPSMAARLKLYKQWLSGMSVEFIYDGRQN